MMLDYLLKQNGLEIEHADLEFVKALIDGKHEDWSVEPVLEHPVISSFHI